MISQLQSLAAALLEMWDLMDTPLEEQQKFLHVTSKIAALESEFTESKILSIDSVIYVSVFFFFFSFLSLTIIWVLFLFPFTYIKFASIVLQFAPFILYLPNDFFLLAG